MEKLTPVLLKRILDERPISFTEDETKAVFQLIGLSIKEYRYHASKENSTRDFEIHFKRLYLITVEIDTSRSISFSNEFINFGDSLSGIAFGGVDTVKELIQITLNLITKIDTSFRGEAVYDEDRSEYTLDEYQALVQTLNDVIFQNA